MRSISVVILFAAGCGSAGSGAGSSAASVEALRAAVPARNWVAIAPVASQPSSDSSPAPSSCATFGASTFGTLTHQIAGNADGVLGGVLDTVQAITQGPPAVAVPGHAEWGPIASATSSIYRLHVDQVAPTEFHFVLAGRDASSDWRGIFQGVTMAPDDAHRTGQIAVDFAVMHALDATVDPLAGGVGLEFAVDGAARNVTASFAGIVGQAGAQPDDAQYAMVTAADQSSSLGFSTRVDFDGDGTAGELAHIDSRWSPSGAGVAHLSVTGGSLGGRVVNAVECWDPALTRVFYTDDATMHASVGDSSCCPF